MVIVSVLVTMSASILLATAKFVFILKPTVNRQYNDKITTKII